MLPRLLSGFRNGQAKPDRASAWSAMRRRLACWTAIGAGPLRGRSGMRRPWRARACSASAPAWRPGRRTGRAHAYACLAAAKATSHLHHQRDPTCSRRIVRPLLGNNPSQSRRPEAEAAGPVVLDIAMSQARSAGGDGPREGWLFRRLGARRGGAPTTDAARSWPRATPADGRHKRAGLAVMMELLTARSAAACSATRSFRRTRRARRRASKLFVAIDVGAFGDRARFEARVDDLAAYLREGAPDPDAVFPGDRAGKRASITSAAAFLFIPTSSPRCGRSASICGSLTGRR